MRVGAEIQKMLREKKVETKSNLAWQRPDKIKLRRQSLQAGMYRPIRLYVLLDNLQAEGVIY